MNRRAPNIKEQEKNRRTILREERKKKGRQGKKQGRKKRINVRKVEKEELLKEVIAKIGLENIDIQNRC